MPFQSLKIIEPILKALKEEGYTNPTPIQSQSIPIVLQGVDLLACAQTGTGKTAAFAIPILQLLTINKTHDKKRKLRSLIITPTRELAIQIGESFKAYGRHTDLKYTVIFGGVNQNPQVTALKLGVDIVVATPGRLLDLLKQGHLTLRDIEIFVLDEADRMLDMGFIHDIKKLIAVLPKKRQSLFFSATMPPEISKLASTILHNPSRVAVTPVSSTVEIIKQTVYFVDKVNKNVLLVNILNDRNIKTALVFTRTKQGANKVAKMLLTHNITAEAIHGNKTQSARQRALTNFKAQSTRILVATDIAARGIDVDELEYVINYELPDIPETYVHRIGRTGRAGAKGTALSFCDAEEKADLHNIEKLIAKKIPVIEHAFPLLNNNPVKANKQQRSGGRSAKSGRHSGSAKTKQGSSGPKHGTSKAKQGSSQVKQHSNSQPKQGSSQIKQHSNSQPKQGNSQVKQHSNSQPKQGSSQIKQHSNSQPKQDNSQAKQSNSQPVQGSMAPKQGDRQAQSPKQGKFKRRFGKPKTRE